MEENNKERKEEQRAKLEKVVKALRTRMESMKDTYEKKSVVDQKKVIQETQVTQKKVNKKLYAAMKKQVPEKMREVVITAIAEMKDANVDKKDWQRMIKKIFSDKTYQ